MFSFGPLSTSDASDAFDAFSVYDAFPGCSQCGEWFGRDNEAGTSTLLGVVLPPGGARRETRPRAFSGENAERGRTLTFCLSPPEE